jgi:anti-sigma-K factor RskA
LVTHEDYKEMLAAYALGALEAEEVRALEEHLRTCADCAALVAEWSDTTAALALSAQAVEPPTELRARILESIRSIPQNSGGKLTGGGEVKSDSAQPEVASNVIQMPKDARRRLQAPVWFGAIAASIAIIALATSLFVVWKRLNRLQYEIERERANAENLARELTAEREMREMLTAPGVRMTELAGMGATPAASAKLAVDPQTGKAMLFAYNLPPAPAGKAYQLWYISDIKNPVPGAVFDTDARGRAVLRDQVPEAGRGASVFAVTLEPAGGVHAPTGDKYLLSPLS